MCGINGVTWNDPSLVEMMNWALKHRGPDDNGIYLDELVTLGHQRLSIIDLSSAGKQPMSNEDGNIWIIYNGEIYNFLEIRAELLEKKHEFTSSTDTEVIIHAYEEWGNCCVEKFNGMWAFAIYDKRKKQLLLSRDRFGVKPLYYFHSDKGLIFSSEIKCLLQHYLEKIPNDKIIFEYLAYGFLDHTRETFFKNIYRLMPGENLIYDLPTKSLKTERWYDLNERIKNNAEITEEHAAETIKELLSSSISYRLIADVPVGSCLSGGIDSSTIVYLMRKLEKNTNIKTFSLIFPGLIMDESCYINQVIKDTKIESYWTSPTIEDLMNDLYDIIWTQEEPFRSISIYGQYKVMELAHKKGMKVLLDGQGADELFAGYFIYYKYYLFQSLLSLHLMEAWKALHAAPNLKDIVVFPLVTILSQTALGKNIINMIWLTKSRFLKDSNDIHLSNPFSERGFDLNKALYSDLIGYSIPQLLRYEDKNSMRWSIESRVPFLDYRLVEFVLSLPPNYKIHGGITKYILRKAIRGLVSNKIVDRKDKIGFATPDKDWLTSEKFVNLFKEIIESNSFASRKYWDKQMISKIFQEHIGGIKDHSEYLWRIINLELWIRIFMEGLRNFDDFLLIGG
ncbi:MAG: asparagine synthase (glutamine-hydrolyzing) [Methanotrichaceae archaeon]|nr:asparagine synthase (glutamine-hydrolyzing) [Methanotrichaceae archaeon]